jgi:hypothetical protein
MQFRAFVTIYFSDVQHMPSNPVHRDSTAVSTGLCCSTDKRRRLLDSETTAGDIDRLALGTDVPFADENLDKFLFANERERRAQLNSSESFNNMPTSISPETPGIIEAERTALLETLTQPVVRLFDDRERQNAFFMDGGDVIRAMDNMSKADKAKEALYYPSIELHQVNAE